MSEPTLLVDISNTRTKFALSAADGTLTVLGVVPTGSIAETSLKCAWGDAVFSRACVSSVVPSVTDILCRQLKCPFHVLNAGSRLNLSLSYREPAAMGADRIAAAMALAEQGALPAIAVDAGTAVTYDVLAMRHGVPCHIGGAISPGLGTMIHALAAKAEQLPEIPRELPAVATGRDTVGCLQTGVVWGFVDMVRGLVSRLCHELESDARVVLTGGDAALLAPSIPGCSMDPCLVFKGLQVAAKLNP